MRVDLPAALSVGKLKISCDMGGTFTDIVVGDERGLRLFKAPSTPNDPVAGILSALESAAAGDGTNLEGLLSRAELFVHATTRATNALLTGTVARTAFLTTEGHRDILLLREGGRLNPYDNAQRFPQPYVPRSLTFEVPERIGSAGKIVRPLDEGRLAEILDLLAPHRVEAVGVCYLWSTANPLHELRTGEMLARRLPPVAVTLSHQINPILREYRRASSACVDASLKPLMARYLADLDDRLQRLGFAGRLLVVTSQGGFIDAREAAQAPIHMVKSGPSVAPVAGRHLVRLEAPGRSAIVTDTGGTSYDVSLVRDDRIPWTSETWLGPRFNGHLTGFPSVDVKSIGAGGGSIAWVDQGSLLHVGPASAGAVPGPVCYGCGGTEPTVTDCALVLGYLDGSRFLGGRMRLDDGAARRSIQASIAVPLGLSTEAAALAVLDLLTQNMVSAIEEITVQQGIDPAQAVLVAGGGAAGFNSIDIGRRLRCRRILFPETGAALSAAGAVLSELVFNTGRMHFVRSDSPDLAGIARMLQDLQAKVSAFVAELGSEAVHTEYWAEARYPQQTWEIDVPLRHAGAFGGSEFQALVEDFHAAHQQLYAVCDPGSPVEIIAWRARAGGQIGPPIGARLAGQAATNRTERRRVYLARTGWTEVPVYALHGDAVADIAGPAIVQSPFTTILVPAGSAVTRLPSGSLNAEWRHCGALA
jgi:N-methylhydantoinase A